MTLALNREERIARMGSDIRIGVPVVVLDGENGGLVLAAEVVSAERLAELRDSTQPPELAITLRRAQTLKVAAYDGDVARIAVPDDAGARWVHAMADPSRDLEAPMKGPFKPLRGGSADIHRAGIALAKRAHLLPAALVLPMARAQAERFALDYGLNKIEASDLLGLEKVTALHEVSAARVPLEVSEQGRVHVFRPRDGGEEHYAIEIGNPNRDAPVLSRLHSACFTGDLLGSLKCDCGPQLRAALAQIGEEGAGVLLYMNQEGRGIGLANKMRAYALQDQGFDTVEANHRLGFEDDERDFRLGAEILKAMGFNAVRLMTNNPAKVAMMESSGVAVTERVPLRVGQNPHNDEYLATKAKKSGHLL